MDGDVVGSEGDRRVDTRAKVADRLPRQPRDEVEVDRKRIAARHFIRAVHIRRRVPAADAHERVVAEGLRVDTDARDAVVAQQIQLLFGEHVGAARLDGVFDARGKGRGRVEHAAQLCGFEHERRAAADVDAVQFAEQPAAGGDLPFQRVQIGVDVLARLADVGRDERAIFAFGRAERDADIKIGGALFARVDPLLRAQNVRDQRDVRGGNAAFFKQRPKVPARGGLRVRQLGRADARQRAPGHGAARLLTEGPIQRDLGKALGVAAKFELARIGHPLLVKVGAAARLDLVQKAVALRTEGVPDVRQFLPEQAEDVHQFGI